MPYTETHTITLAPITLPVGVAVELQANGSQAVVTISGTTATSKDDTVSLLKQAFAELMTAASAEGVGAPVFQ